MKPTELTPLSTLLLIWAAGGVVTADGDRLIVSGARMCEELREAIRRNKPDLLRLVRGAAEHAEGGPR